TFVERSGPTPISYSFFPLVCFFPGIFPGRKVSIMRFANWLCGVALCATVLSAGAFAAEKVADERYLPGDTIGFVKIPSAADFRDKWADSSFGAMENDPAFADFIESIETRITKL